MNNKLPPQEQMVVIPIGMDCRGMSLRIKGVYLLAKQAGTKWIKERLKDK